MSNSPDVLAPYRVGPPWMIPAPMIALRCPMCYRLIGEMTMTHGRMALYRGLSKSEGLPQHNPPSRWRDPVRHATGSASHSGGKRARRTRGTGWTFVSPERDRWRIWCEHKQRGRGPLDRTVTAATLERLYGDALAAGAREVVLS